MKEQEDLAKAAPKEESIVSSLRLAYKDLEIQMKKDEKLNISGKKMLTQTDSAWDLEIAEVVFHIQ